MKIRWQYEGEQGFWISAEGRFQVSPIYIGRTTPQGYELRDGMPSNGTSGHTYKGFYTVAEAKSKAERIRQEERNR